MNTLAHDLFLLMTNLSQLQDKKTIISLYETAISSLDFDFEVKYQKQKPENGYFFHISTSRDNYGFISYKERKKLPNEAFTLFQNSVQLLATILENLKQKEILTKDKGLLEEEIKRQNKSLYNSEQKQKALIENISDVIGIVSEDGIIKYKSPNIKKWFGWDPEDLQETDAWLTVHPDDLDYCQSKFLEVLQNPSKSETVRYRYKCKDNSYKWIELTASNQLENQFIRGVLLNYKDISSQVYSDEIYRTINTRLNQAQKVAGLGNWEYDLRTSKIWGSEEAFIIFGLPLDKQKNPEQLLDLEVVEQQIPERERVHKVLDDLIQDGKEYELEYEVHRECDNQSIIIYSKAERILDESGNPVKIVGTIQDITRRKNREKALKESEEKSRALINAIPDLMFLIDDQYRFVEYGEDKSHLYTFTDFHGKSVDKVLPPDIASLTKRYVQKVLGQKEPCVYTYTLPVDKPGKQIFESRMVPAGESKVLAIVRNVTSEKEAERALKDSEERFRSVIEQSNDAIYIIFDDHFDLINKKFSELTGLTETDVRSDSFDFKDSIAKKDWAKIEERKKLWQQGKKPPNVYEFTIRHKSGEEKLVQASVKVIDYKNNKAILGILRDFSEIRRLEEQLRHSQKMESIGHLAGGVAHDFNNLLTPIIGNSELMMMNMEPGNEHYSSLNEIKNTAERAGDLTRQLLAFSRKQILEVKETNLNSIIRNFRNILKRTIRENINININYGKDLGLIKVDVSQIEQILMNLFVNAQDAMKEGGTIFVETSSVRFSANEKDKEIKVAPGKYTVLSVRDTGSGIDRKTLSRIFDPFFTTKAVGKGTGLGLSTVYGIVKQHGGDIWVYSEVDVGTVFKIYLPSIESEQSVKTSINDEETMIKGHETILVVEDQDHVRSVAVKILKKFGYEVYDQKSSTEALSYFSGKDMNIDLLLTDIVMPGMNGKELSKAMMNKYPKMKVLFMSGYTQDVISQQGIINKGINFIQKPLTVSSLTRKVREVLDSK